MSLKELETQVQQLPETDLTKFGEWFDDFRESKALPACAPDDLAEAQQEEVLRRQAEFLANPSSATAWDDGFFDRLRLRLVDLHPYGVLAR